MCCMANTRDQGVVHRGQFGTCHMQEPEGIATGDGNQPSISTCTGTWIGSVPIIVIKHVFQGLRGQT
jgi:hypothetical protein